MPQNFIECDRDQTFLMPPSLRDWLPEDDLAWCVIDAVREMDLSTFYAAYRRDGHGRPAYNPAMMVALVLYAFATQQRSSRAIERHCRRDIAYRVIASNRVPDHATIARFIDRHEAALSELFGQILALCAKAGLVKVGVVAIDGTKVKANASPESNCDYEQLAREIVAEARATDEAEDELYGEARGDELPEHLRTAEGRRAALREAKEAIQRSRQDARGEAAPADGEAAEQESPPLDLKLDPAKIVTRSSGRRGWLREAARQLEEQRAREAKPVPRTRALRLQEAERRMREEVLVERAANDAYEHFRAHGRDKQGRRLSSYPPKPYEPPATPHGKINLSDPDSKPQKTNAGFGCVQGYNPQAVVSEQQIVLAAEVTNSTADFSQLGPMVKATLKELNSAGIRRRPTIAIADAGYWNEKHMDEVVAHKHIRVLIPPDAGNRETPRPGWSGGRYAWMRAVLSSERGKEIYRKRKRTIEPVFGHTKHNRGIRAFHRRGRSAVRTEWRLLMATHNLVKLHRHRLGLAAA
jgi:transposase